MAQRSPSQEGARKMEQQISLFTGWRLVRLTLILGALSAFGPLSMDMYLPSLPALGRDFGAMASTTQLTLSACMLGLAVGQMIAGPFSDTLGRRRPLLVGLVAYVLASLLCVVAPSISLLIGLRLIQGAAGAAGIVIARAIVRDVFSGTAVARFFAMLMLVSGIAPIVAPLIGSLLLQWTSWRGVFVVLALVVTLMLLTVLFGLQETLPQERRQNGKLLTTFHAFRQLLRDRFFVGYALSLGLSSAAMFSYISGSPFVLQDIYGLSPQVFSLIFGANALGIALMGQVSGRLVGRVSPQHLLAGGLIIVALGGIMLLLVVIAHVGLGGLLPAFFVIVASQGLVLPNASALAMSNHPRIAGSASALLGVLQFALGSAVVPLVGIAGTTTALPLAWIIAIVGISALWVFFLSSRTGGVLVFHGTRS